MIEKVLKENVEITIIPKLKECNTISLQPGDTLLVKVNTEKWNLEDAHKFYNLFSNAFPNNNILITFDGIEIGVIKEK